MDSLGDSLINHYLQHFQPMAFRDFVKGFYLLISVWVSMSITFLDTAVAPVACRYFQWYRNFVIWIQLCDIYSDFAKWNM